MVSGRGFITLSELCEAVGGKPAFHIDAGVCILNTVIDSRQCTPDCLFIPLAGENTDGHLFIDAAVKSGAGGCLVSEVFFNGNRDKLLGLASSGTGLIIVPDTLKALQDLGRYHIGKFPGLVRIGITGSSGKTTTKEIMGTILSKAASTVINAGNLNSEIGLPLSVLNVSGENKYAVFEMGMNRSGEMDILTDILRPDIGVVTNIGTAHIGFLGSQKAIAGEKKKIFSLFDGKQAAFLFEDDPWTDFLAKDIRGEVFLYGRKNTPGFEGAESLGIDGYKIRLNGTSVRYKPAGGYNLDNALCAVSVSDFLGIDFECVKSGLESAVSYSGRGEVIKGPVTIIQDCYNANYESLSGAVEFTDSLPWNGRKVYVLGAMKELGDESRKFHSLIGELLSVSAADAVFFFGKETEISYSILKDCSFGGFTYYSDNYNDLENNVLDFLCAGDLVLLKGSRSMELERLVDPVAKIKPGRPLC